MSNSKQGNGKSKPTRTAWLPGVGLFLIASFILMVLGIGIYLVWSMVLAAPDGALHLTFLNVGSADAVLIQTPGGGTLLVGGGPSSSRLSSALGQRLPYLDRRLDWLVVASTEQQELASLPGTLVRFPAERVLWSGLVAGSSAAVQLNDWLSARGVPITAAYPGTTLDLGQGARLEVSSVSRRGAVLQVEWRAFKALLPIGIDLDSLGTLQGGTPIGPVTVLLLADSGSEQTNPPGWLAVLNPWAAVLSVQAGDPQHLPAQSVLDHLRKTSLLRTDRNGWISLSTDGTRLWVVTQKK